MSADLPEPTECHRTHAVSDSTAVVAGTWGANQGATAAIHIRNFSGGELELRLRTNIGNNNQNINGYEVFIGLGYCQIVRWNGGINDFTVLFNPSANPCSTLPSEGATVTASVITTTCNSTANSGLITAWVNGSQVMQMCDTTPIASGSPGIGMFNNPGATTNGFGFSCFAATDSREHAGN